MSNLPLLIESMKTNGGSRSVTKVTFPADAKALKHYHTEYRETFKVYEGELTVIISNKEYHVRSGQVSPQINLNEIHTYRNDSGTNVTVDIILEPGHLGCELANNIVAGLDRENRLNLLTEHRGYNLLYIAFYEITNTIPVGIPGYIYSMLKIFYGRRKINHFKQDLIKRYVRP